MRNKWLAAVLAFFLGSFGIHKFYLGRTGWGILYLLFFWSALPGLVSFIEGILYLLMSEKDFNYKYNYGEMERNLYEMSSLQHDLDKSDRKEVLEQLEQLNRLRISGALSEAEYQAQKRNLMS